MSNRFMGEVTVRTLDGASYTVSMDMDAMVALEEHFSTPEREVYFNEIWQRVNGLQMKYVRAFVWKCFHSHHPDLTEAQVTAIVQRCGGVMVFLEVMGKLMQGTAPDPEDLKALGIDAADPHRAQAASGPGGTGPRLNGKAAASV